jgi:hypothetical protein
MLLWNANEPVLRDRALTLYFPFLRWFLNLYRLWLRFYINFHPWVLPPILVNLRKPLKILMMSNVGKRERNITYSNRVWSLNIVRKLIRSCFPRTGKTKTVEWWMELLQFGWCCVVFSFHLFLPANTRRLRGWNEIGLCLDNNNTDAGWVTVGVSRRWLSLTRVCVLYR